MIIHQHPYNELFKVVRKMYPKLSVLITYPDGMKELGRAEYYKNGKYVIALNGYEPIEKQFDILIHELAHVVVTVKGGHGKKWLVVYNKIGNEYTKYMKRGH